MEAKYYQSLPDGKVRCTLCPHECIIKPGKSGICRIRHNSNGVLIAESYQLYSALHFDPVEKKPLYHFYPGKEILSLGSVGCNLHCNWCQNYDISQKGVENDDKLTHMLPETLVKMARIQKNSIGIAYTYNEPSISIESVIETARLCKENGLKNVMVTNGYIGEQAMTDYLELIDAFNIDVKAFREDIYQKYTGSKLEHVLKNIILAKKAGKHVELTYLVVTDINDKLEQFIELVNWIANETGKDTVLHISRYFPRYKLDNAPTSAIKLQLLAEKALETLDFVYLGNIYSGEFSNTRCPTCKSTLVTRKGYSVTINDDCKSGICPECKTKIFIDD